MNSLSFQYAIARKEHLFNKSCEKEFDQEREKKAKID